MRLRSAFIVGATFLLTTNATPTSVAAVPTGKATTGTKQRSLHSKRNYYSNRANTQADSQTSLFRGWDYLVSRLQDNGVSERDLIVIYGDKRMPERSFVPFSVHPREPASIYESFKRPEHASSGISFIEKNSATFKTMEAKLLVPAEVVAAIIVVESQAGRNTGKHQVLYRLSRIATVNAPDNLQQNYIEQKRKDHRVTFADVRRRGRYLERTFLPEIPALIAVAKRNKVDVLTLTGSPAGAIGLPQFLPSALLRYGVDGDRNGSISLHDEQDAIWSAANYLAHFEFKKDIPSQEKRAIIWRYNKSKSYIDTVLSLSDRINELQHRP